ncbi:MAG: hypothetical protein RMI93_02890 [Caldimicrobium sp.]|nr:hypothetical protein [Caldimicrobium sp.]MDW8182539.1 hypothetical protein [Caldimicrobium sp.]
MVFIEFIQIYRREHPCKEKLKPLVDGFCRERGIALVSVSTIGRIIKYLKERVVSLRKGIEEALVFMGRRQGLLRGRRGGKGCG